MAGILRKWRNKAEPAGHEVVETISCYAQPSGKTVDAIYEELRDTIVEDLRAALPIDIVLLTLHGAMIAQHYDDCEGDLISRARAIAPNAVIGVVLDPHCHLTPEILNNADLVILAKEYPHIDMEDRAEELYDLCLRTADGLVSPIAALADASMIGFYPTFDAPMQEHVAELRELEREPGVLSASIVHGFPWSDVAEVGTKVLVYADADSAIALNGAERIAKSLYDARHTLRADLPGIESSLDASREKNGRVVLGDFSDNPGGGAPGDSTFFLRAILERGTTDVIIGAFWDPVVAQICADAGAGAVLNIRLGGKNGPASGDSIDLTVDVRNVLENHDQNLHGNRQLLGRSAWLHHQGIDILVCSVRSQILDPDAFTGIGMSLDGKRLVVVKSSNHYVAGFRNSADHMWHVQSPGALSLDFANIQYSKRTSEVFPRHEDPWLSSGRPATLIFSHTR